MLGLEVWAGVRCAFAYIQGYVEIMFTEKKKSSPEPKFEKQKRKPFGVKKIAVVLGGFFFCGGAQSHTSTTMPLWMPAYRPQTFVEETARIRAQQKHNKSRASQQQYLPFQPVVPQRVVKASACRFLEELAHNVGRRYEAKFSGRFCHLTSDEFELAYLWKNGTAESVIQKLLRVKSLHQTHAPDQKQWLLAFLACDFSVLEAVCPTVRTPLLSLRRWLLYLTTNDGTCVRPSSSVVERAFRFLDQVWLRVRDQWIGHACHNVLRSRVDRPEMDLLYWQYRIPAVLDTLELLFSYSYSSTPERLVPPGNNWFSSRKPFNFTVPDPAKRQCVAVFGIINDRTTSLFVDKDLNVKLFFGVQYTPDVATETLHLRPRVRDYAAFLISGVRSQLPRDLVDVIAEFLLGVRRFTQQVDYEAIRTRAATAPLLRATVQDVLSHRIALPDHHQPGTSFRGEPNIIAFVLASPQSEQSLPKLFAGTYPTEPPVAETGVSRLSLPEYCRRKKLLRGGEFSDLLAHVRSSQSFFQLLQKTSPYSNSFLAVVRGFLSEFWQHMSAFSWSSDVVRFFLDILTEKNSQQVSLTTLSLVEQVWRTIPLLLCVSIFRFYQHQSPDLQYWFLDSIPFWRFHVFCRIPGVAGVWARVSPEAYYLMVRMETPSDKTWVRTEAQFAPKQFKWGEDAFLKYREHDQPDDATHVRFRLEENLDVLPCFTRQSSLWDLSDSETMFLDEYGSLHDE